MKRKKPYKYSKKVGRYVPSTNTGNREFYFGILLSIYPMINEEFPEEKLEINSTFGKFLFTELISNLRLCRNLDQNLKSLNGELRYFINNRDILEHKYKRKAIEDEMLRIAKSKHKSTFFFKAKEYLIGLSIGFFYYLISNSIVVSTIIFFISWIATYIIVNILILKKLNLYNSYVENALKNYNYEKDLSLNEKRILLSVISLNEQISFHETEISKIKEIITIKTRTILNDDFIKFVLSDHFYNSTDWKTKRNEILEIHENVCVQCGISENLSVDHIQPRSKFPERALESSNLQILCLICNSSKGNKIN